MLNTTSQSSMGRAIPFTNLCQRKLSPFMEDAAQKSEIS
jgi:hypothetical protein